jgi:hypothetical protein
VLNDGDASGILLVQDGPADQQAPDGGQQAPDDGQQAPDDGQEAPDDGQQAPDYGQQAPDYGQQAFDYGQQAFDDDQPTYSSPFFLEEIFANMVQQVITFSRSFTLPTLRRFGIRAFSGSSGVSKSSFFSQCSRISMMMFSLVESISSFVHPDLHERCSRNVCRQPDADHRLLVLAHCICGIM